MRFGRTLAVSMILASVCLISARAQNAPLAPDAAPAPPPAMHAHDKPIIPPWANTAEPVDPGNHADFDPALGDLPDGGGKLFDNGGTNFGPSNGMQVNLATGAEEYVPDPDMTGHNGIGTDPVFRRAYRSDRALAGYGSPGLSPGWVHNYDVTLSPVSDGQWSGLLLKHCTGSMEILKPILDTEGKPTGKFETGKPFDTVGVAASTQGQWQAISLTWQNQTHWLFLPFGDGSYVLSGITNLAGNGFYLQWDSARRLRSIVDSRDKKPLLTLLYDPSGNLSDIKDAQGTTVHYRFGLAADAASPALLAVSTIFTAAQPNALSRYKFTYISGNGRTLLKTISVPDPGGPNLSTSTIQYGAGKVIAHIDAEGNQHRLTYADGHTFVQIAGPDGKVVQYWTQNYDALGRDTGVTDANGHSTHITY